MASVGSKRKLNQDVALRKKSRHNYKDFTLSNYMEEHKETPLRIKQEDEPHSMYCIRFPWGNLQHEPLRCTCLRFP